MMAEMNQLRITRLAALLCLLGLISVGERGLRASELPADLKMAQVALQQNLALGESLAGRPATREQAGEAKRLVEEGLARARAHLASDSGSAEAHRLAGLLLCIAYTPVEVNTDPRDERMGRPRSEHFFVLLQGAGNPDEGLAELQAALHLSPKNADYQLDYAEALLVCGRAEESAKQSLSIWEDRAALTGSQRLRAARLLARAMKSLARPEEEARWLREVLKQHPGDAAAAHRLAELTARTPKEIAWQNYEAGMALASRDHKPVLMDFSATWCGWCKKLEAEVFTNPKVIALSRRFVCIKVDGDKRRDLVGRYGVRGYPTGVLLDAQGREVRRMVGYRPADQYLAEMQRALGQ